MKIVERCGTMGDAAGEQARNMAMVRVRKPVNQVGAGRRRNREVRPPSGEFVRESLSAGVFAGAKEKRHESAS